MVKLHHYIQMRTMKRSSSSVDYNLTVSISKILPPCEGYPVLIKVKKSIIPCPIAIETTGRS